MVITELPENSPRYVVLSYELKFSDGRVSYPLVLISWAPVSSEIGMMTLHATALQDFQNAVSANTLFDSLSTQQQSVSFRWMYRRR